MLPPCPGSSSKFQFVTVPMKSVELMCCLRYGGFAGCSNMHFINALALLPFKEWFKFYAVKGFFIINKGKNKVGCCTH